MTNEDKAAEVLATVASFTAEYIQSRLLWQCGQMAPGADQNEPLRNALQQLHANPAEGLRYTMEGQEWHSMARYGAGLIDADAWEMREICQGMAEWLFAVPGSNAYTIPASSYATPMGALWAMALIRTEGDELITIAEAAQLAGVSVQAISQRIERGKLQAFINPFAPERQGRQMVRRRDVADA